MDLAAATTVVVQLKEDKRKEVNETHFPVHTTGWVHRCLQARNAESMFKASRLQASGSTVSVSVCVCVCLCVCAHAYAEAFEREREKEREIK